MVKLHVPFLFFFARGAVPITPNAVPEAAEQTGLLLPWEKREWNGGIDVCAAVKAPVGLSGHDKPDFVRNFCRRSQRSGTMQLDLSNLIAKTEYHMQLVLSTLIFKIPETFLVQPVFRQIFALFQTRAAFQRLRRQITPASIRMEQESSNDPF